MTFDFGQPFPIKSSFEAPSGSSVPAKTVLVGGSDGTNIKTLNVDPDGKPRVNLHDGNGLPIESELSFEGKRSILTYATTHAESASGSSVPVRNIMVAGSDGSTTRTILVDPDGKPRVNLNDGNGLGIESALDFEGKRNILAYATTHTEAASGSDVPVRNTVMAGSDGTKTRTMATDLNGQPKINLHYGEGSPVPYLLDNAGMKNLPVSMTHNIFLSTNNSSTANLAAGASFQGLSDLNLNADAIQVNIKCDQPVTILIEQSNDNINWDFPTTYTLDANQAEGRLTTCVGSYVRVKVRNDGLVPTTYFNLQCVLVPFTAILPQSLTDHGNLKTSIEEIGPRAEDKLINADRAIYGQGVTSSRTNLLFADFQLPLNNADITISSTGGGSVTAQPGYALLSTGAAVTASAKIVSNRTLKIAIGRESEQAFSAAFTTPTHASSFQEYGLYDANNGFKIKYKGLDFGIAVLNGGVETFINRTDFNRDKLNGTSSSEFKRNGLVEPINLTFSNKWRIRFGRTAKINFEVLNPDGNWILFHVIQTVNTSNTPIIQSTVLPFTAEVSKNNADATVLEIRTSSVEVSIVDNPSLYGKEDVKGRKYVTAAVSGQTTSQSIYTVSTGRKLKVDTLIISLANTSLVANGLLNVRDGNGGTILVPLSSPASTNQTSAGNNLVVNFPTPLRFSTAVYAQIASGNITFSLTFVGYEEEA